MSYAAPYHEVNEVWQAPPLTGILAALYDEAKKSKRERTSTSFWRAYFGRALPLDEFESLVEANPDRTQRAVDITWVRFLPHDGKFKPSFVVEVKRDKGDIGEAEEQAQDASWRYITDAKLSHFFAITTHGTKFRLWVLEKGMHDLDLPLRPLDGGKAELAHRNSYIDIRDQQAERLVFSFLEQVYNNRPLTKANTPPDLKASQEKRLPPISLGPQAFGGQGYSGQGYSGQGSGGQGYSDQQLEDPTVDLEALELDSEIRAEPSKGKGKANQNPTPTEQQAVEEEHKSLSKPSNAQHHSENIVVRVKRVSHTFGKDQYVFKDVNRHEISSSLNEWKRGHGGWYIRYQGRNYVSRTDIHSL